MRGTKKSIFNGNDTNRRLLSPQNLISITSRRRRPIPTGPLAGSSRHDIMTETKGMKSPSKSFDVFEFREKEELTDMAVKKIAPEVESLHGLNAENYAQTMLELHNGRHNDFNSCERDSETKSEVESGINFGNVDYGSSPGATLQLEDNSNDAFPVSSCNVKSVCLGLDAVNNMTERSPSDISNNDASSGGMSSDNCFGGDLDDERVEIVFYADYLYYRGTQYMDSVVSFSKGYIEARCKTIHGDEESFHLKLEIEDIIKIESQWSAQFEAGMLNIYFISRDAAQVDFDTIRDASELQELKFTTVESNWYEKRDAIESLDLRYRALWNVVLDAGMEKCSSLTEKEDWMPTRSYFPNFDRPFEEVIYPKGDPDAVSISKRDIDLLLPDTFLNDTIIDFYIKYLKTKQNVDERAKFHFFNSFFFRKLADMDKDPSSAFDGKAAFQRVRKWTRKVNLLEKDFILIPVNYNLHWSLIVICYFGEVASYKDEDAESGRVPCILHMDSLRGTHSGLKDLLQSYLWEEWKERQKEESEDLHSKFRNLKFVSLELPQQQNSYDCGLFLLHYVELFLDEVPSNFNVYKITPSSKFLEADWFPPYEPSIKRTHIERLINGLLETKSEECPPSGGSDGFCSPEDLNTTHSFDNDVQFSLKSNPLVGCHENSLCQVRQGIEMTLLPTSSTRNIQCTGTSGLVLKELFKQVSAPESFTNAPWGALENRASLYEEEAKASDCFVTTDLAEHVFGHPDGVTPEAPGFSYPSEDYVPEAVYRPTSDDIDSTPVTSGALLTSGGGLSHVDISDDPPTTQDSFFMKDFSEIGDEAANQSQNHAISDEGDAAAYEMNDPSSTGPGNGGVEPSGWDEEQPSPKRMRIDSEGVGIHDHLAQDLNL